jgi:hypothetical protein
MSQDSCRESELSGELRRTDQKLRIERLKAEVRALNGGEMSCGGDVGDDDLDVVEAFWEHVADYERAPQRTLFAQLQESGVALPPEDSLDDAGVHAKLWEVIGKMAELRNFLSHTDHLSDRGLYAKLWNETLRVEDAVMPASESCACHIDLIGSGSDEDILINLRYYADDLERDCWESDVPDDSMPTHEDPPCDRDRHLPSAYH